MDVAIRLEKLRFSIAEMQIAFELSKRAPDSFTARKLAMHVVMRAENFIEHSRAIRKPLNIPTSSDYHVAKEAYATTFAEYYGIARDKIGAHFQDLDFGKRIEIWNAIDQAKVAYFVDGAIEIYGKLGGLGLPGFVPYSFLPFLSDVSFKQALGAFSIRETDRNWVEMSADPLAVTRENSTVIFNSHPIHARAGQVTLIKRWIGMLAKMLPRFGPFPDVVRIIHEVIITDFVSYCDCLVTRPVPAGAPQAMDGLNTILAREGIPVAALDDFIARSRFDDYRESARAVRNKIGAHLDDDDATPLAALLSMLDSFDTGSMLVFLDRLQEAFRAICVGQPILSMHAADGQRIYGITPSKFPSQPYFDGAEDSVPSLPTPYSDDEESYKRALQLWLDGDEAQRSSGRQFFLNAVQQSQVVKVIEEKEMSGQSYRLHRVQYRRVYEFFEEFLKTCDLADFAKVVELFQTLSGMDPNALAEVLVRSGVGRQANKDVWISFALGDLAAPFQSRVAATLEALSQVNFWSVRLQAIIARFKIYKRAESFYRANHNDEVAKPVSEVLPGLLSGKPSEERLIILLAVVSQIAWGRQTIGKSFDGDRATIADVIEVQLQGLLKPEVMAEVQPILRQALAAGDYVCIAALLGQKLKDDPDRKLLRQGLLEASCNGTIIASPAINSARNLAMCFLQAENYAIALEQAQNVAARAPGDLNMVGTILTVLCNTPGAEENALAEIVRLKASYKLARQNVEELDAMEIELKSKLCR